MMLTRSSLGQRVRRIAGLHGRTKVPVNDIAREIVRGGGEVELASLMTFT